MTRETHPYTTPARPLDLNLYLVTGDNPLETVRAAKHATCIQVRSKPISARELYQLTEAIAGIIQPHQTLLIDDRVDVSPRAARPAACALTACTSVKTTCP